MLVIRLGRVGRKKLPHYRMIVQEKHVSPKRGKVVERLGEYNPISKELKVDKDRVKHFLDNGAQPSNRVARILKENKFDLPDWVKIHEKKSKPKSEPEETEDSDEESTDEDSKDEASEESSDAGDEKKAEADDEEDSAEDKEENDKEESEENSDEEE